MCNNINLFCFLWARLIFFCSFFDWDVSACALHPHFKQFVSFLGNVYYMTPLCFGYCVCNKIDLFGQFLVVSFLFFFGLGFHARSRAVSQLMISLRGFVCSTVLLVLHLRFSVCCNIVLFVVLFVPPLTVLFFFSLVYWRVPCALQF